MGTQILYLKSRKAQELIAYLLCSQGGPMDKRKLCGVLWPEVPEHNAMDSFYKVCRYLHNYRDKGVTLPFEIRRGSVWLDPSGIDSDIVKFLSLYENRDQIEECKKAVDLYTEPLYMDECYDWITDWEGYFEIKYFEMLSALIEYYQKNGPTPLKDYYMHKYDQFAE